MRGFRRVFSGFTTGALADIIAWLIAERKELHGVWNVSAAPINKFDLLTLVKQVYGLDVEIEPDEAFVCDRSLDSGRLRAETGFVPPAWPEMMSDAGDATPYKEFRRILLKDIEWW